MLTIVQQSERNCLPLRDLKMSHELNLFLYQVIPRTFIFFFINSTKSSLIFRLAFPAFVHINLSMSTLLACETSSPQLDLLNPVSEVTIFFGLSLGLYLIHFGFSFNKIQQCSNWKLERWTSWILIHNLRQRYLIN